METTFEKIVNVVLGMLIFFAFYFLGLIILHFVLSAYDMDGAALATCVGVLFGAPYVFSIFAIRENISNCF